MACSDTPQKLAVLELVRGEYVNVPWTQHLSGFVLHSATVRLSIVGKESCGLSHFCMDNSIVSGLPADGICACTSLKTLSCSRPSVDTVEDACKLNTCQPAHLSALTALTQLESLTIFTSKCSPLGENYYSPIYMLTMLMSLRLSAENGNIRVCTQLAALSTLSRLMLGNDNVRGRPRVQVKLDVDWNRMHNLQELFIQQVYFHSNSNLTALTQVALLQTVCFSGSQPVDVTTTQQFASLVCRLSGLFKREICVLSMHCQTSLGTP